MVFSLTGKRFRIRLLKACICLACGYAILPTHANDAIQFNIDVLDVNDRKNIDLSQFSRSGYIMPGVYNMAIHLNKSELPEQNVNFYPPDNDDKGSQACLTAALVEQLGLKPSMLEKLTWWHNGECLDPASLKGMEARGDLATSALYLSIPQAYLEYTAENWGRPRVGMKASPGCCLTTTSTARFSDNSMTAPGVTTSAATAPPVPTWAPGDCAPTGKGESLANPARGKVQTIGWTGAVTTPIARCRRCVRA